MTNVGKQGEDIASEYLEQNGYEIIHRNFRCKAGEIDIAAREIAKPETVVIIEVKARRTFLYGLPCESVTAEKKRRIVKAAEVFASFRGLCDSDFRFDVMEVLFIKGKTYINHIKNAF